LRKASRVGNRRDRNGGGQAGGRRVAAVPEMAVFLALAACLASAAEPRTAGKLILVEKGVSLAPVVVFEGAPPMTRRAADELAQYIEKTSGAKPAVIEGEPKPVPKRAIWVGRQPVLKKLFPKIEFDFKRPEEILIAANEDHLVIAGRDRWDPDRLVVKGRNATINGKQSEYGTANAVYTFLEDYLGVRWLWPGEEDIDRQATIAFAPFEYRYHPQIRQRAGLFRLSALGDGRGVSHEWTRFQRLQLDSLPVQAGHAFGDWWDKYHKEHPDYFALQPDGTRSGFPGPGKAKICQANPAVWEQWLANVAERLKTRPDETCFSASPNDSWNRGHCICEKCRAWDNPDGAPVMLSWEGLGQEYVSLSDRQVTFANTLARLLKKRFPDRKLYVGMHAYGDAYLRAPLKAVPDDNVFISVVACFFLRKGDKARLNRMPPDAHRKCFSDWAKVTDNLIWRPNAGNSAGWHVGLPDIAIAETMKDFRFVAENHCIGLFFDTVWEHWATQAPQYYVMAQLAWDPWQDGKAMLEDYYRRGFGPAADNVKAYWTLLEDTRAELLKRDLGLYDMPKVYTKDVLDKAARLLEQAAEKAADQPKYARRVAFVRVGFEYTRLLMEARALVARFEDSKQSDMKALEEALAVWEDVEALWKEHPSAFNTRFLAPPDKNRRMQGFHPFNRR